MSGKSAGTLMFVGTYTRRLPHVEAQAEGIYACRVDPATGVVTLVATTTGVVNPSYLTLSPDLRFLYAVNEVEETDGQPTGGVSAFSVDLESAALTALNRQPSHGTAPCHIAVDKTGRYALVANYGSGSVACIPIGPDGSLGAASDVHQHAGSSANPERQQGPHAHSINVDPRNGYALVCDLGLDRVLSYRLDLERGKLVPAARPHASVAPGSGPRHFDFHPSGRYAYAINELSSTMTAFAYDAPAGSLEELQTLSTLPAGFQERSHCADVRVHPSGRFVYGSNRGHDSIAMYAIDQATGTLSFLGAEPTGGRTPRGFAIDPSGAFLLAANQNTGTIVTFRIDQATGRLESTGHVADVPTPVCIKFAAR